MTVGESKTITFTWDTTDVPYCRNYTITAVAIIIPQDNDPADNIFTDDKVKIRLLGDINGDETVDMLDINLLIDAFLSYPGHPSWNPDADIKNDTSIDMADVQQPLITS